LDDFGNNRSWYDDTYLNGQDEIEARPHNQLYQVLSEYNWLKNDVGCNFPLMQTVMGPSDDIIDDLLENVDINCWHTSGYEREFIITRKATRKRDLGFIQLEVLVFRLQAFLLWNGNPSSSTWLAMFRI
jgi:hypothetical protein